MTTETIETNTVTNNPREKKQQSQHNDVSAHLSVSSGNNARLVTIDDLASLPTPAPTKTWHPVPHVEVPNLITEFVVANGWSVKDDFKLGVTDNGSKMFGVVSIVIPGLLAANEDFGLAIGFRNSHDKSIALQIAVGTNVFVCSNMMIKGDFKVRREHVGSLDVREELAKAFQMVPQVAEKLTSWFGGMRQIPLNREAGISFLADCVEHKALPIMDFMDARGAFLASLSSDTAVEPIQHGGTLWSAYQAVTAQWKKHSLLQLPEYSRNLNALVAGRGN